MPHIQVTDVAASLQRGLDLGDRVDGDERYADYKMLDEHGNPAAGVCHSRGANAGLPPVWMIYLPVGDLAESLSRVQHEGGKVIKVMHGEHGEYAYAAVQDPVGACLALMPG